jgi:copper chaperone CopZ
VRQALLEVAGVVDADVSYEDKRADVRFEPNVVQPAALVAAIAGVGFSASVMESGGTGG